MDISTRLETFWQVIQNRRRQRWPREQLLAYQERELQRLRTYVYAHSPFYRRFHAGLVDRPFSELPVLTKPLLMDHFDELVTDPQVRLVEVERQLNSGRGAELYLGRYWLTRTSGSSGLHGIFVQNGHEMAVLLASLARAGDLAGTKRRRFRPRLAIIFPIVPPDALRCADQRSRSRLLPVRIIDSRDPMHQIVSELNRWKPDALHTYASFMGHLAEEQLAGRLRIAPTRLLPSGEALTDQIRARIESVWGKVVYNVYGAVECGLLAVECDRQTGLHVVNDQVILEFVDAENQLVPPGRYSAKVLVTTLYRRTQPLIRYELPDLVQLEPSPCTCGHPSPLIGDVQGRVWEVLHLPSPNGGEVAVSPLVFLNVLRAVNAEFQVIQEPEGLRVLLSHVRGQVSDNALAAALRQALETQGATAPPVKVERVPTIPAEPSGKVPLVKSVSPRATLAR